MLKKLLTFFFFIFSFFSLSAVVGLLFTPSIYASTLYLSPGSGNIPQGSTKTFTVGINTAGESINGVSAYLSYPADKLEVAWVSYGSGFDIKAERSFGGGGIRVSVGSISGVVGNVTVAAIGFKGKAQGTATVSFIGGSAAARTSDSSESLTGTAGSTITVGAPAPYSTPSTSTTGSSTGSTTTEEKKTDTDKPIIKNVKVSDISTSSATITWETNEEADSTVEYGLSQDTYFLTYHDETPTATHEAKLERKALVPGATFHFVVKSKDASGNEGESKDHTFHLKGYNLKITVLDEKNMPITDTEVLLYSDILRSRTDVNGDAYFLDVTSGKHLAVVKLKNGVEKTLDINVRETSSVQAFTVSVDTSLASSLGNTLIYSILAIIIVALVGIVALIFIIKKKRFSIVRLFRKNEPDNLENTVDTDSPNNHSSPQT